MNRQTAAAVCGCISIDLCPAFLPPEKDQCPPKDFASIIRPGAVTRILAGGIYPGGSVANTGLAMEHFGSLPVLCARIGQDPSGQLLEQMLSAALRPEHRKTALSGIRRGCTGTAYSLILAPEGLDRAILQNPGANDTFCFNDLDFDHLVQQHCCLFHFGHPSTMRRMYAQNGSDLQRIFQEAKARHMVTSLDLCAIDPASDAGQQDWHRILSAVLPWVDLFVPSQDDLRGIFSGTPEQMATESRHLGAGSAWIKCGTQGIVFSTGSMDHFRTLARLLHLPETSLLSWANQHGAVPARRIETLLPGGKEVSGLGAGDVTIAALLTCLMQGRPFQQAMALALAEGALCVTQDSALAGLRPLDQIPL